MCDPATPLDSSNLSWPHSQGLQDPALSPVQLHPTQLDLPATAPAGARSWGPRLGLASPPPMEQPQQQTWPPAGFLTSAVQPFCAQQGALGSSGCSLVHPAAAAPHASGGCSTSGRGMLEHGQRATGSGAIAESTLNARQTKIQARAGRKATSAVLCAQALLCVQNGKIAHPRPCPCPYPTSLTPEAFSTESLQLPAGSRLILGDIEIEATESPRHSGGSNAAGASMPYSPAEEPRLLSCAAGAQSLAPSFGAQHRVQPLLEQVAGAQGLIAGCHQQQQQLQWQMQQISHAYPAAPVAAAAVTQLAALHLQQQHAQQQHFQLQQPLQQPAAVAPATWPAAGLPAGQASVCLTVPPWDTAPPARAGRPPGQLKLSSSPPAAGQPLDSSPGQQPMHPAVSSLELPVLPNAGPEAGLDPATRMAAAVAGQGDSPQPGRQLEMPMQLPGDGTGNHQAASGGARAAASTSSRPCAPLGNAEADARVEPAGDNGELERELEMLLADCSGAS